MTAIETANLNDAKLYDITANKVIDLFVEMQTEAYEDHGYSETYKIASAVADAFVDWHEENQFSHVSEISYAVNAYLTTQTAIDDVEIELARMFGIFCYARDAALDSIENNLSRKLKRELTDPEKLWVRCGLDRLSAKYA